MIYPSNDWWTENLANTTSHPSKSSNWGFLELGDPQVTMGFNTKMVVYDLDDFRGPTWWNGKFKSHQSWLDIFNGHATGTDWLEVPIPYMFGLFFRPKFKGISPQNIALYDITIDHLPSAVNFAPRLLRNVWHNVRVQRVQRFQRLRFLRGTGWSASSASAQ